MVAISASAMNGCLTSLSPLAMMRAPFQCSVMNAGGSDQTRLTSNLGADLAPDWQPLLPAAPSPTATPRATPTPVPVGGVASLLDDAAPHAEAGGAPVAPIRAAAAAGIAALAAGGWYARRRWRSRTRQ